MSLELPPVPPSLRQIQHYLKTAQEHDGRDIVVSYWCRLYALQTGLSLSTHQPDETKLLMAIMDWLEAVKKGNSENESITNEVAAQAHLENYALKLFMYADKQDRESNFGKNVVKAFYTSGMIYDVLQTFGELTEEVVQNRKYAKWKAAYIHNCLKNGETPVPGPAAIGGSDGDNDGEENQTNENTEEKSSPIDENEEPQAPPSNLNAEEVLNNPDKLPSPPKDEEKPGGFEPFVPSSQPEPAMSYVPPQTNVALTPNQMTKAQKYCKYAGSALNFDDVKSAIENLQKALHLLQTGQEM